MRGLKEPETIKCRYMWYAAASDKGTRKLIKMHRLILNAPHGTEVDHRDGNGLNNTRDNLRLAVGGQNKHNRGPLRNNKSGYKGVWQTKPNQWGVQITHNSVHIHVGVFTSPEDAARAYDAKAKELFGEFAWLNFPEGQQCRALQSEGDDR